MSFYLADLELGKSRYYFKPNILSANGTIIVTDPKAGATCCNLKRIAQVI